MTTHPIPPQHPLPRHRREVKADKLNQAKCEKGLQRCIDMYCPRHCPLAYVIIARHKVRGW